MSNRSMSTKIKSEGHQPSGSGEEYGKEVLPYMGMVDSFIV